MLRGPKFYDRDLSWLQFNHRVLQEAADAGNPLYERIKFLAIFSSNLDEFFRVRVSAIRQLKKLDKDFRKKLISRPNKLIKEIKKEVDRQQEWFGEIYREQIIPGLRQNGIHIISRSDFNREQKTFSSACFETFANELKFCYFDRMSPESVDLDSEAMAMVVDFEDAVVPALVRFPKGVERFVVFPPDSKECVVTFIDDILRDNLHKIFENRKIRNMYAVKLTRDAELYLEEEYSGALVDAIYSALGKRKTGQATRLLVDKSIPQYLLEGLKEVLGIDEIDLVLGGTYHNFKDFFSFPGPPDKRPGFGRLERRHPEWADREDIFEAIEEKDRLLHFPYHSFDPLVSLIEDAADREEVTDIKISLYRVGKESRLLDALMKCCEHQKRVFVFIEAQARFDEEFNILWGKAFEEKGARVVYSFPGIKVHSKILLICSKDERGQVKKYGYIATGNFNEKNSGIYGDLGIVTANEAITSEVDDVFQVLSRKLIIPRVKHTLVSPFNSRIKFMKLIAREMEKARMGKGGYIFLKMNSLQDPDMIEALYRASSSGVEIVLVVRGICCLIPGVRGQSENIRVISIVGRFLEHSRIYLFGKDEDSSMYIGSADWMKRNLDYRIEVIIPVPDRQIKDYLLGFIDLQLADNVKAREIDKDQSNSYVRGQGKAINSQEETISLIKYLGL
ncbi:polyphosphate kinase 1 [Sinomicrobium kalidii]|uniref:polyphosphate kinase 1 n=1 Tax=Sinomicrobium kalidii TaxID=2900738 RepID=UPI001E467C9B|nr:polyphosphate kinase 1 [Sinomicrobium kalidii]UGU16450.1 polyphosphate kinase 1 [Sinomicrobium kalidii]